MSVQTRSVLKTYFETGDKPTAAQFGDLIDSALMAKYENTYDSTLTVAANTIYDIVMTQNMTVKAHALDYGESCIINAYMLNATTGPNFTMTFSTDQIDMILYAQGYNDVKVDMEGVLSYALLKTGVNDNANTALMVNRAFYSM